MQKLIPTYTQKYINVCGKVCSSVKTSFLKCYLALPILYTLYGSRETGVQYLFFPHLVSCFLFAKFCSSENVVLIVELLVD